MLLHCSVNFKWDSLNLNLKHIKKPHSNTLAALNPFKMSLKPPQLLIIWTKELSHLCGLKSMLQKKRERERTFIINNYKVQRLKWQRNKALLKIYLIGMLSNVGHCGWPSFSFSLMCVCFVVPLFCKIQTLLMQGVSNTEKESGVGEPAICELLCQPSWLVLSGVRWSEALSTMCTTLACNWKQSL